MFSAHPITRHLAIEAFKKALWKAKRDNLFSKLTRKSNKLKCYEEIRVTISQQKRYRGVIQIPTQKITGSVGRNDDFDGSFRPLKKHLRDRWVRVAVQVENAEWPAIEVVKIEGDYYVVDGHHRASVARSTGIAYMDAEVWEFSDSADVSKDQINMGPVVTTQKPVPVSGTLEQKPATCCSIPVAQSV